MGPTTSDGKPIPVRITPLRYSGAPLEKTTDDSGQVFFCGHEISPLSLEDLDDRLPQLRRLVLALGTMDLAGPRNPRLLDVLGATLDDYAKRASSQHLDVADVQLSSKIVKALGESATVPLVLALFLAELRRGEDVDTLLASLSEVPTNDPDTVLQLTRVLAIAHAGGELVHGARGSAHVIAKTGDTGSLVDLKGRTDFQPIDVLSAKLAALDRYTLEPARPPHHRRRA